MKRFFVLVLTVFILAIPAMAEETPTKPESMDELWEMYLELLDKYNTLVAEEKVTEDKYDPWIYEDGIVSFLVPDPVMYIRRESLANGRVQYLFQYRDREPAYPIRITVTTSDSEYFDKGNSYESNSGYEKIDDGVYYQKTESGEYWMHYLENDYAHVSVSLSLKNDSLDKEVFREVFDSMKFLNPDKKTVDSVLYSEEWQIRINGILFDDPELVKAAKRCVETLNALLDYEITAEEAEDILNEIAKHTEAIDGIFSSGMSNAALSVRMGETDLIRSRITELQKMIDGNPDDVEERLKYRR